MRFLASKYVRVVAALIVVVAAVAASTAAFASGPLDLHNGGDLHEGVGQADGKPLQRGVTYGASTFPLSLSLRPPDDRWQGVQLESGKFRFVQLGHLRTGNVPRHGVGVMTIEASTGPTGTVAQTVARLHATPHIEASSIKAVRVAGLAGQTFDATIVGTDNPPVCKQIQCTKGVSFAPFAPNHHCGFCTNTMKGETQDVKFAGTGQLFRITVIGVRGKTVVIYAESDFALQPRFPPAKTYPTFLPYAQQMLAALHFSG